MIERLGALIFDSFTAMGDFRDVSRNRALCAMHAALQADGCRSARCARIGAESIMLVGLIGRSRGWCSGCRATILCADSARRARSARVVALVLVRS